VLAQGVGALLLLEAAGLWYRRRERGIGVQERRARATLFGVRRLGQEALGFKRKTESRGWHLHACKHID
jgi:DNA-binding GntR family transcriptional regulator